MVEHHLEIGAGVTVAAIPVPKRRGVAVRRHRGRRDRARSSTSTRSRPTPPTMPGDPTPVPGVDGQLRLRHPDADRHRHARRATTRCTDIGGDVIPALTAAGRRPRVRLLDQRRARAGRARARLLARRRDARRLLRGQHGPHRAGAAVQPLQRPVAGVQPAAAPLPPAKVSTGPGGERRTSTAACCAPARSCRAGTSSGRSSAPASTSTATRSVTESILFPGVRVGPGARLHRCIIDKNVEIPARAHDRPRHRGRPQRVHRQRPRRGRRREGPSLAQLTGADRRSGRYIPASEAALMHNPAPANTSSTTAIQRTLPRSPAAMAPPIIGAAIPR